LLSLFLFLPLVFLFFLFLLYSFGTSSSELILLSFLLQLLFIPLSDLLSLFSIICKFPYYLINHFVHFLLFLFFCFNSISASITRSINLALEGNSKPSLYQSL